MSKPHSIDSRMNIRTLVWPIFVENLMRMSLMSIDVFMLAQYSNNAVAAVGLTSHLVFFMMLTFMIVSTGSAVLIGQNLGANKNQRAQEYSQNGLLLILVITTLVSTLFLLASPAIMHNFNLAPEVETFAVDYLTIVGGLSFGVALSVMFSTILRAYGYTKSPMVIQVLAGLINLVGNYIAIFPPFGWPQTGVIGVAFATAISQILSALMCWFIIKQHKIPFQFRRVFAPEVKKLKKILAIGLPNAGESISYNLAQITIMFFIAQLGTAALAAVAIVQTISRFMFVFSLSLGSGAQILSSYYVGQRRFSELKQNVHKYWILGLGVSTGVTLLTIAGGKHIAAVFSDDATTQSYVISLLVASLFLESGRALNLIIISALKGAGDVIFPVKVGIVAMWGVGVLFAYLLGIHWAFGLVGIWLAIGLDEWVRGIIMIFRWRSERWMTKSQLDTEPEPT